MQVKDIAPKLRRAIMLAREAGLVESAAELETRAFAAYTTSSEWLGAVGDAIRRFPSRERVRVPTEVAELLNACLEEIGKVWPNLRR
jgi:hypothetical protein